MPESLHPSRIHHDSQTDMPCSHQTTTPPIPSDPERAPHTEATASKCGSAWLLGIRLGSRPARGRFAVIDKGSLPRAWTRRCFAPARRPRQGDELTGEGGGTGPWPASSSMACSSTPPCHHPSISSTPPSSPRDAPRPPRLLHRRECCPLSRWFGQRLPDGSSAQLEDLDAEVSTRPP